MLRERRGGKKVRVTRPDRAMATTPTPTVQSIIHARLERIRSEGDQNTTMPSASFASACFGSNQTGRWVRSTSWNLYETEPRDFGERGWVFRKVVAEPVRTRILRHQQDRQWDQSVSHCPRQGRTTTSRRASSSPSRSAAPTIDGDRWQLFSSWRTDVIWVRNLGLQKAAARDRRKGRPARPAPISEAWMMMGGWTERLWCSNRSWGGCSCSAGASCGLGLSGRPFQKEHGCWLQAGALHCNCGGTGTSRCPPTPICFPPLSPKMCIMWRIESSGV